MFILFVIDFVYSFDHILTNFAYTSHLFLTLFIPVIDSFFVYTSHNIVKIVYKSHQRPRGGERLAGRYIAEERFLRRLRLSRLCERKRPVGASRVGHNSGR